MVESYINSEKVRTRWFNFCITLFFFIFLLAFHCHHYSALPPPVVLIFVTVLSLLYSVVSVPNLHGLPLRCPTCNHTNSHLCLIAVGRLEEALECALTYLLFHEGEEFVMENVGYYREELGHDGKPREVSDTSWRCCAFHAELVLLRTHKGLL